VLLVNVSIGVGLFVATITFLAPSAASGRRTRIDVAGAVTVTLAAGVPSWPSAGRPGTLGKARSSSSQVRRQHWPGLTVLPWPEQAGATGPSGAS
jgi:hypothetical protein